jgi:hypothetical protein
LDQAAVDANDRSGDIGGPLAGEEGHDIGILLRIAVAANGDGRREADAGGDPCGD